MESSHKAIIGGVIFFIVSLTASAFVVNFIYRPLPFVFETVLELGLFLDNDDIQRKIVYKLRKYPTRQTALTLAAFINAKNMMVVPENPDEETEEEKMERLEQLKKDLKLAARALESLCVLTGKSFGTSFERYGPNNREYRWASIPGSKWRDILGQINNWALALESDSISKSETSRKTL